MNLSLAQLWPTLAPDLPEPIAEYRFCPARRFRFDFAWPAHRLAVELDGGQYLVRYGAAGQVMAGGRHNGEADRAKGNVAAVLGWRLLHFSKQQFERDPAGCVSVIRAALEERP